jgi:hypothetical protein
MSSKNAPYGVRVEIIRHIILIIAAFVVIVATPNATASAQSSYSWQGQFNPKSQLDLGQIEYRK